jgi:DNA ligase (NAD+)
VVAESLAEYFADRQHQELLGRLLKEIKIEQFSLAAASSGQLAGQSIVVTGTLESMSRTEAQEKARQAGADVNDSVSQKTNYLVVGANPGSKLEKAKKLGVKILSENEFLELIQ